jgi:hemolysin III
METRKKSWLEKNISLPVLVHPEAEKENWISHAIPAVLCFIGLIYILINLNNIPSNNVKIGMIIFALTNILLYTASTFYHYLPKNNYKRFCRILDHSNIYFLIAGTYTPIMMYVGTSKAILLAKIIWSIAFLGIAFTLVFWGRLKPLHVILYIAMGWFVIFFMDDLLVNFPPGLVKYLIVGGLSYTIGVIFYGFKKIPHGHLIWHLFTIAGSACFYIGFLVTIM